VITSTIKTKEDRTLQYRWPRNSYYVFLYIIC